MSNVIDICATSQFVWRRLAASLGGDSEKEENSNTPSLFYALPYIRYAMDPNLIKQAPEVQAYRQAYVYSWVNIVAQLAVHLMLVNFIYSTPVMFIL